VADEAIDNLEKGFEIVGFKLERLKEYFCEDDSNFDGKMVYDNLVYLLTQLPVIEKVSFKCIMNH